MSGIRMSRSFPARFSVSIVEQVSNRIPFDDVNSPLLEDYGEIDDSRPSILTGTAMYILVTEFCERLAYFGFAGSLVLFFQTHMSMSNADADVQYAAWSGACYITPLLGGLIADSYLGRYRTILIFSILYAGGLLFMLFASLPGDGKAYLVFPAIYIIAIGTGGIKPNVCTMGADQFDERYSQDRKEKDSYFSWFYWSINIASIIAYTAIAYICQFGIPDLGGESYGFFVGYAIPCVAMISAICIFVLGTSKYTIHEPNGSIFTDAMGIVYEAVWVKFNKIPPQLAFNPKFDILDRASQKYGGSYSSAQVESIKLVARLVPFLISLIPFWGIYSQIYTTFQNQGCQMDLSMGSTKVPISTVSMFESVAILIFVPIFDKWLFPKLKSLGYTVSPLQKMGVGFILSMFCMIIAAAVETYRISLSPDSANYTDAAARDNITPCQNIDDYDAREYQKWYAGEADTTKPLYCHQICGGDILQRVIDINCIQCDDIPQVSHMSVFWQIPQFFILGISIALTGITALEFFYTQAPLAMRSVTQSLNLFTVALGTWITIPLVLLVNMNPESEWLPPNLDNGHLAYYFLALAGFQLVDIIYFWYISRYYVYKTEVELQAHSYKLLDPTDGEDQ